MRLPVQSILVPELGLVDGLLVRRALTGHFLPLVVVFVVLAAAPLASKRPGEVSTRPTPGPPALRVRERGREGKVEESEGRGDGKRRKDARPSVVRCNDTRFRCLLPAALKLDSCPCHHSWVITMTHTGRYGGGSRRRL